MAKHVGRIPVLFIVLVLSVVLCAFLISQIGAASKPDPYGKWPSLVEATTGRFVPMDPQYAEGEDLDNNELTKYIKETVNFKATTIWTTSDQGQAFSDKVNMLIASDDLPDYMEIQTEPYGLTLLKKMVKEDMIMDLTKVYADYASPRFKENHKLAGNIALNQVTFNKKLMAIPNLSDTESEIQIVWVRQDWLDKLGLKGPKTIADLEAIAKAFVAKDPDGNGKDDTLGILGSKDLCLGTTNTFDFIFNAYKSYPQNWINYKGKVAYGSILPETRTALAKLAQWYKEGLLDPEFALKDGGKATETVVNGTAGIMAGAWWSPWWPLNMSVQNNSKANWKAYGIQNTDGKYVGRGVSPARNFLVIKKGFKAPGAIIIANNYANDAELKLFDWFNKLKAPGGKYEVARARWPVNMGSKYIDEISRRWSVVKGALDGKTDAGSIDPEAQIIYNQIKAFQANPCSR